MSGVEYVPPHPGLVWLVYGWVGVFNVCCGDQIQALVPANYSLLPAGPSPQSLRFLPLGTFLSEALPKVRGDGYPYIDADPSYLPFRNDF